MISLGIGLISFSLAQMWLVSRTEGFPGGGCCQWPRLFSLKAPLAASSSSQYVMGMFPVITSRAAPGVDGMAPVMRTFASPWNPVQQLLIVLCLCALNPDGSFIREYGSYHDLIDPTHGSRFETPRGANRLPTLHQDTFAFGFFAHVFNVLGPRKF